MQYSFTVHNTGNQHLTGLTVTDPLLPSPTFTITCADVDLAVGESTSCTVSAPYELTQVDIDAGAVVNIATASATAPGAVTVQDTDTATVVSDELPSMTLVKSGVLDDGGDGRADVGDTVAYSFLVTNTGNQTLTNLVVTDTLLVSPTFTISCPTSTLAPGAGTTCTAAPAYALTQADLDAGNRPNTATAEADDPDGDPVQAPDDFDLLLPADPSLQTVKSSSTADFDAVGDVIDYEIVVTNTGNVTVSGVVVSDPTADAGSITCTPVTPAVLAPGDSLTCSATHTVTQVDVDGGSVVNVATATGEDPNAGPVSDPSDAVTVPAVQVPDLTVVKASSTVDFDAVGDVVAYTITVTNTGNVTLDALVVSDPVADVGSISCPDTVLDPAEVVECTATHTVTQTDLDNGSVVNTANAAVTDTNNNPIDVDSNQVTVLAVQNPLLETVKSSSTADFDAVGDVIDYEIVVTNTGNVTVSGVVVSDPTADAGSITCTPVTPAVLAPGDSLTCSATHTVTQVDVDGGSVVNVATATGEDPNAGPVSDPSDAVTVPAVQVPDLTVVKASSTVDFDAVGDVVAYTITVTNTGNVTLDALVVSDPVADVGSISCPDTVLDPAEVVECTATHTVTQTDLDNGSVVNTANAAVTDTNNNPIDVDSNQVTVLAVQNPLLETVKSSSTADFDAVGDVIDYEIVVTNTGNVTVSGVVVSDPTADAGSITCTPVTPAVLAPGDSLTCSATHTVTQVDVDGGSVVNVATATGEDPNAGPVSDPSDAVTVPAVQVPDLTVVKASSTVDFDAVGDVVAYTITVTNTGNVTLDALVVSDPVADVGSISCPDTVLDPAEVVECTATHTVTQTDLDNGSVVNTANAAVTDTNNNPIDVDSNQVTVLAVQNPLLSVVKATSSAPTDAGDVIAYTVVITNTGNVTLDPVTLADPIADAGSISCDVALLAPAAVANCTLQHTVTQAEVNAGEVRNTATATFTPPAGGPLTQDSNEVVVTIAPTPSLVTTKATTTADFDTVGDVISYTFTVTNTGNVTLSGIVIADPVTDDPPVCTPTTLDPGDVADCTAVHTVVQGDLDAGAVVNVATGNGTPPAGPAVEDPSNQITVPAVQTPSITVTKALSTGGITEYSAVGEIIDYTFTVTNTGNVTLTGVAVTDPVADSAPVCLPTTLAPTATSTCTAQHAITQVDLDAGSVVNTADVSAAPPSGPNVTDTSNTVTVPAVLDPELTVSKVALDVSYAVVGDVLDYTITVENTGNVTLDPVVVTDDNADAAPVCDVSVLAPNATATCTASHVVDQADLDAGQVDNIASATGTPPIGPDVSDDSPLVSVPAVQSPSVLTTKSTATVDYDAVGDVISYTITVENTGNVTLTGVGVTDAAADATPVCAPTTLAPTEVATCTATHTVVQADLDAGSFTNIATGSGTPPTGPAVSDPSDPVTVPAVQTPSVLTTKSTASTSYSAVGDVISYTITVENTGNVTLTGVGVTDAAADATPVCAPTTLAPTEVATCTATHTVVQADLDAGSFTNIATGSGTPPTGPAVSDPSDPVTVPAVQTPSVLTTKSTASTSYSAVGDVISYTITVENTGNVTLGAVSVNDPIADAAPACAPTTLAPTETATCAAQHTIDQDDLDAGSVVNIATGSGAPPTGPAVTDPSDPVTVPAVQNRALEVVKSTTTSDYDAVGDVIDYTFTVTNTGNVTLTAVEVADPLADVTPVCSPTTLAPTETATCTAEHTIDQGDLDAGSVVNVADASAQPPGGPRITDPSNTVTVPAVQLPSVLTTKSSTTVDFDAAGDVISYTITVENTGNVTLTGVSVSDPIADAAPVCAPTTLAPTEVATCTAAHTVTQADLDAGQVSNIATGSGVPPFGAAVSDPSDEVIVPAVIAPSVLTTKTTSTTDFDAVGDVISYTITVQNTGNVTLSGVSVSDANADATPVCVPTTLAPAATATCTATHTVTQTDLDNGQVTNIATGSGQPPTPVGGPVPPPVTDPSDPVVVPAVQTPSVLTIQDPRRGVDHQLLGDRRPHRVRHHGGEHRQRHPHRCVGERPERRRHAGVRPHHPGTHRDGHLHRHPHRHPGRSRCRPGDQHRHRFGPAAHRPASERPERPGGGGGGADAVHRHHQVHLDRRLRCGRRRHQLHDHGGEQRQPHGDRRGRCRCQRRRPTGVRPDHPGPHRDRHLHGQPHGHPGRSRRRSGAQRGHRFGHGGQRRITDRPERPGHGAGGADVVGADGEELADPHLQRGGRQDRLRHHGHQHRQRHPCGRVGVGSQRRCCAVVLAHHTGAGRGGHMHRPAHRHPG